MKVLYTCLDQLHDQRVNGVALSYSQLYMRYHNLWHALLELAFYRRKEKGTKKIETIDQLVEYLKKWPNLMAFYSTSWDSSIQAASTYERRFHSYDNGHIYVEDLKTKGLYMMDNDMISFGINGFMVKNKVDISVLTYLFIGGPLAAKIDNPKERGSQ